MEYITNNNGIFMSGKFKDVLQALRLLADTFGGDTTVRSAKNILKVVNENG